MKINQWLFRWTASETQMDIQTLPGGIYVAALQKDGVIVQRTKLAVMR